MPDRVSLSQKRVIALDFHTQQPIEYKECCEKPKTFHRVAGANALLMRPSSLSRMARLVQADMIIWVIVAFLCYNSGMQKSTSEDTLIFEADKLQQQRTDTFLKSKINT